jgi:hypothetical protein
VLLPVGSNRFNLPVARTIASPVELKDFGVLTKSFVDAGCISFGANQAVPYSSKLLIASLSLFTIVSHLSVESPLITPHTTSHLDPYDAAEWKATEYLNDESSSRRQVLFTKSKIQQSSKMASSR